MGFWTALPACLLSFSFTLPDLRTKLLFRQCSLISFVSVSPTFLSPHPFPSHPYLLSPQPNTSFLTKPLPLLLTPSPFSSILFSPRFLPNSTTPSPFSSPHPPSPPSLHTLEKLILCHFVFLFIYDCKCLDCCVLGYCVHWPFCT